MAATENKVQFGLKDVHYAVYDEAENTYGTPVPIRGAVNLALEAEGDMQKFYADNVAFYVTNTNNGYSGDLEVAKFPEQMLQDVWGFVLDAADKVLIEMDDAQTVSFALLYRINGDQTDSLFCLYNCTATRPGLGSQTKEETTEPRTQTVSISCVPMSDGKVYARTTKDTPETIMNGWFNEVYLPSA